MRDGEGGVAGIEAGELEGEELAGVPEDHRRVRVPVEHPGHDHAHGVAAGGGLPAPQRAVQLGVGVEDVPAVRRRHAGVQVQRYAEVAQGGPDPVEGGVVEVAALDVVVDERASEPEALDASTQFRDGGGRVLERERREGGEPAGVGVDYPGEAVVDVAGVVHRAGRVGFRLDAGDGEGEHLQGDAVGVHVGQPVPSDVGEPCGHVGEEGRFDVVRHRERRPSVGEARDCDGLFNGDVAAHQTRPTGTRILAPRVGRSASSSISAATVAREACGGSRGLA